MSRIIDSLEAYLRVTPPSIAGVAEAPASTTAPAAFLSIATKVIEEDEAAAAAAEAAKRLNPPVSPERDPDLDTLFADEGNPRSEVAPA